MLQKGQLGQSSRLTPAGSNTFALDSAKTQSYYTYMSIEKGSRHCRYYTKNKKVFAMHYCVFFSSRELSTRTHMLCYNVKSICERPSYNIGILICMNDIYYIIFFFLFFVFVFSLLCVYFSIKNDIRKFIYKYEFE